MWLLPLIQQLNITQMQKLGCKLSAEDIYNINNGSLKDAVVIFGGGCTGEIVSQNGLLFTNHHCGYSSIQQLSSVEHNYLANGFWAKQYADELPVDGLKVTFLKRMDDVTGEVLKGISDDVKGAVRDSLIDLNTQSIIAKLKEENNDCEIKVESYLNGNQYFSIIYEVYKDVRLVGTPPETIGKFGHDTDNWMWPRHTCDFSVFRVYADKDGKPSKYSADNVPLTPKHYLPISLKDVKNGDYAMTIGFPGSTERYLTSWGIKETCVDNNVRIAVRGAKQAIWLNDMHSDENVNIQYSSKYARSSNYWKNSIGMNRGIKKMELIAKKQSLENEFAKWVAADTNRTNSYGKILSDIESAYNSKKDYARVASYIYETSIGGIEIYRFARNARKLVDALSANRQSAIDSAVTNLREVATKFYKDYNPDTDRKVVAALLQQYKDSVDAQYYPSFFDEVKKRYDGDFEKYANDMFRKSIFANESRFMTFLDKPSQKVLEKDMAFAHSKSVYENYISIYYTDDEFITVIDDAQRAFLKGLMEMNPERKFYSDANFTMRLSYGTVGDYSPADGVKYNYFTTMKGVMEKEDPNNWEFIVSPKLKDLYQSKDFGRYADADGSMHVCFITNNDITGGNSGSPVINGDGQLIGLAFDGNWEGMSGDIVFEDVLQKCICVDIRYVLFIIEKYGEATNLINELKFVD